jgi:drug/metabolite transporter (DMT)-like permease
MWILFAFLAPALYAVAEIFDEYLSNRIFKKVTPIVFLALVLNFVFVPVLFIIQKPVMPSAHLIWPLIGVGLTNLLYLFPYYKSLKVEDTSIVSAFFSIGKIIIPVFAFVFIGEVLQAREYLGIAVIIFGNVLLAFHTKSGKVRLSKAFYLIILASTILAIDGILYKYMFDQGVNWSTAIGGQLLISGVLGCAFFLINPVTRKEILKERDHYKKSSTWLFFTEEIFTFLALGAEAFAISLAPVSLVKGIGMSIPIFVLLYTLIVKKYRPKAFHENTGRGAVIKKVIIFGLIILGLVLVGVSE